MASGFSSCIFIIFLLLVFLCAAQDISARKLVKQDHDVSSQMDDDDHHHHDNDMDPSQKIFFTMDDLKKGKSMEIYICPKSPSKSTYLLSREEADTIPFSSSQLPYLLRLFSISEDSPQAQAINDTLSLCQLKPTRGETKLCVTSFESMLDFARGILGSDANLRVFATSSPSTSFLENPTKPYFSVRNFTVAEEPREVLAPKMVACHSMPYPYAVFYCHSQEGENRVFEISLEAENGEGRVEAVGVCHVDTSHWDRDHVSFRVLNIEPGTSPVCHVFPPDNLVWVP